MHAVWFTISGLKDFETFGSDVLVPAHKSAKAVDPTVAFDAEYGRGVVRVRITGSSSRTVGKARRLLNLAVIDAGGSMRLGR